MKSRPAYRVTMITAVAALVGFLAVAGLPGVGFADDGRWERKGAHKHGRQHGAWGKRPAVVSVSPAPVVVAPQAVIVPPVVVVPPQPAYVWIEGHYETRQETRYVSGPTVSVWVPPRFEVRWINGRFVSVEVSPGYHEYRPGPPVAVTETVQVWVPGRWVPATRAAAYRADHD